MCNNEELGIEEPAVIPEYAHPEKLAEDLKSMNDLSDEEFVVGQKRKRKDIYGMA